MQDILNSKYEYSPDTKTLFFKYDESKGADWNNRFSGKEVKPVVSNGKRYIFIRNSLYSMDQAMLCMVKGDSIKLHPCAIEDLLKVDAEVKELIKKSSIEDLTKMVDRIGKGSNIKDEINNLKGVNKRLKSGAYKKKELHEKLNKADVEINERTGYPKHIFKRQDRDSFYIEVKHNKILYKKQGFQTIDEALDIRNKLYDDLLSEKENGYYMNEFFNKSYY